MFPCKEDRGRSYILGCFIVEMAWLALQAQRGRRHETSVFSFKDREGKLTVGMAVATVATTAALAPATTPSAKGNFF